MFRDWNTNAFARGPSQDPQTPPSDGAVPPSRSGLISTSRVATIRGWCRVEDLAPGDKALTFDAGLQTITKLTRQTLCDDSQSCPRSHWPLSVPAGALGNREPLLLLPNQSIMVESDTAEDLYGDPFTLIPSSALEGLHGIEAVEPHGLIEIVHVHFKEEQVMFGEHGTLFLCPSSRDIMDLVFDTARDPIYTILPIKEARIVAETLDDKP